ncbi:MAG: ferredoxin reductase [Microthrixaceae bacterium]|nr:ferredoxin reductase [Microthrixaceae bacterium]
MFTQTRATLRRAAQALTSPLPVDAYLAMIDPLWSSTSPKGRVVTVTPETARSATIVIHPGAGFGTYEAGQWVTVGVEIDGVRHRRCYSLTSDPEHSGGLISITVSAIPDGLVSNHLVYSTEPGEYLTLEPAAGDFHLPTDRTVPMLFITGGSGITPAMGMIRTLVGAGECHDVVLMHHAPSRAETIFADELADLAHTTPGLTVNIAHTGAGAPPPELALTPERLDRECPDWRSRTTWACGPAPMLDDAEAAFDGAGRPDRLSIERFAPKVRPGGAETGEGGRVRFTGAGAGTETVLDGSTTLLDGAEAAGLTPAAGCRMGICHTCVVPLESGCVSDVRTGELIDEPGTHVQICVSAAAGDVEIAL